MGAWMKQNGESIYGAGRSPFGRGTLGVWTAKDDKVYRHVFYWPGKEICAAEIKSEVCSIYFLHNKEKIDFVQKGERVFLKNLPNKSPNPYDTVIVFKLKKRLDSIPVSRVEREWH